MLTCTKHCGGFCRISLSTDLDCKQWLEKLAQLKIPSQALVIEITERMLLESDKISDENINTLQTAGIELALDDFGTGYSSLSYLKRFDINYIKIDRSFVCNLHRASEDVALCQAIIVMAHQLGIQVVAEGVETQEQHSILLEAGCDFGQGADSSPSATFVQCTESAWKLSRCKCCA